MASLRDHTIIDPNNDIIVDHVINPVTDDDLIQLFYFAGFQRSVVYGHDGIFLRNLIDSAININSIKLKFDVDLDTDFTRYFRLYFYLKSGVLVSGELFEETQETIHWHSDAVIPANSDKFEEEILGAINELRNSYGFYFTYQTDPIDIYRPYLEIDGERSEERLVGKE